VTSGLGGLAEVCGPDALVVDPNDAEAVAKSLEALVDSEALRQRFARAGRARVEALYDIRSVAGKMDDFVAEVVGGRQSAH
jgi:glycosyltransferase involved in cell wall biosynthesis